MSAALKRKLDQLKETADAHAREEAAETRKRELMGIRDACQWLMKSGSLVDLEEWKLSLTNLSSTLQLHENWKRLAGANLVNKLIDDWSFFSDLSELTYWMTSKGLRCFPNEYLRLVRRLVDQCVSSGFTEKGKGNVLDCLYWLASFMDGSQASKSAPFAEDLAHIFRAFWDHHKWTDEERNAWDEFGSHLLEGHNRADLPLPNAEVCFFFTPRKSFAELHAFFLDPESEYQKAKAAEETLALQLAWDAAQAPPVVSDDEEGTVDYAEVVADVSWTEADQVAFQERLEDEELANYHEDPDPAWV